MRMVVRDACDANNLFLLSWANKMQPELLPLLLMMGVISFKMLYA
jgi:hypothetical protein